MTSPTPLVSLDEIKAQLNITDTDSDTELSEYLLAATDMINARCGFSTPTAVSETVFMRDGSMFRQKFILSQTPVVSITSITPTQQGIPAVDLSTVVVDADTGIVYMSNYYGFYGTFAVTYQAGRQSAPPALQLACKIIVQSMWETQRGAEPLPVSGGDDGVSVPADGIPYRALQLMRSASNPHLGIA